MFSADYDIIIVYNVCARKKKDSPYNMQVWFLGELENDFKDDKRIDKPKSS